MAEAGEQSSEESRYYGAYPLTNPAYNVIRIAGRHIRRAARQHFSGRLLEIGCGTKAKAALIGDLVAEHVGLDHEDSFHGLSEVDLIGSADDIPSESESFDCVLSTSVLEHLEEPQAALREAFRVLRPGGVAIYTAPLYWHIHEPPRDFFRYTEFGLQHLFSESGFERIAVTPMSGFWTTFGAEFGYYIKRFGIGPGRLAVGAVIAGLNLLTKWLDRGPLRDERFTWMYLVVAHKPEALGGRQ